MNDEEGYALRHDQWQRIEGLLLGREEKVGVTARDMEAVLYCYRAGTRWRDLRERFGLWKAVHTVDARVRERRLGRCFQTSGC